MESQPLPSPRFEGPISVEAALRQRRSVRELADTPLEIEQMAQLLWAAQGITDPSGGRSAPSAGALHPLQVFAVTSNGIFHYDPQAHAISQVQSADRRAEMFAAALEQECVRDAPLVIVIAADYRSTEAKYGRERAERYVHLEAGHAAENVLLQAVALGLGAVAVGAFKDRPIMIALDLHPGLHPVYLIPVGHPRTP